MEPIPKAVLKLLKVGPSVQSFPISKRRYRVVDVVQYCVDTAALCIFHHFAACIVQLDYACCDDGVVVARVQDFSNDYRPQFEEWPAQTLQSIHQKIKRH